MGEKPGRREAMDKFVKTAVSNGMDHKKAKDKAREVAERADRREARNNRK